MLDIVLDILAVIGIILLILLAVLVTILILVLFVPITYRAYGCKNPEKINAWLKANWLLGLLRIRFCYPEPGNLTVKLLWFTLFDTAQSKKSDTGEKSGKEEVSDEKIVPSSNSNADEVQIMGTGQTTSIVSNGENSASGQEGTQDTTETPDASLEAEEAAPQKKGLKQWILNRYEKIRYTIQKIYDKIKHIWENITFYKRLLQDEQTVSLIRHACFCLGRILKSIRPRKIRGDVLFGTGSPDTTGYAFGIYGMLLPWLGKHINVTPDFTQSILEGNLYVAGHITVFQLLRHSLMVILDKRLRLLLHRIKTHKI